MLNSQDSSRRRAAVPSARLIALLLIAVSLLVYHAALGHSFVNWDDRELVYENPYLNPVTPAHLLHFWTQPYDHLYIPVTETAYAALALTTHRIGMGSALAPRPFHAAGLLVHILSVLLVFAILRRLVRRDSAAGLGALLYAVHPLQVETVVWTGSLDTGLGNCLSLAALWQYLQFVQADQSPEAGARSSRQRYYWTATLFFVFALLSKPSAVTVILLAGLLDWALLRHSWQASIRSLAGWIAPALAIALVTRAMQAVPPAAVTPLWARPLIAGDALAFGLGKLVWPSPLAIDYGRTPSWLLSHPWACLTVLVPLALGVIAWHLRRRHSWPLVCLGLFAAALLPVSGLIPFAFQEYSTVADRYYSLALLGPALGLAFLLARCPARSLQGAALLVIGAFGCLSLRQVGCWENSVTLFTHAIAVNPNSYHIQYNLANALNDAGDTPGAISRYRQALRLQPGDAEAHCNLGAALMKAGRVDEAADEYRQALRLNPGLSEAHEALGLYLVDRGNLEAAIAEWQTALRLQPENQVVRHNLEFALRQASQRAPRGS
ncbi:MAG: tetratricopeptide repeat protein [Armatimonadota bacterium]|nr:tetratricopeptide repeat protein [Armatimonadota bacterium]